jgi:hypothetical protein
LSYKKTNQDEYFKHQNLIFLTLPISQLRRQSRRMSLDQL